MTSAERQERMALLRRKAALQRQSLKTYNPEDNDFAAYFSTLQELDRIERVEAGFRDIMVFAKTYFTGRPPHDLLKDGCPSPPFHYELAEHLRSSVLAQHENKTVVAAPRGHAKSTIITNIFVLWTVAYADDVNERYWVIIGDKQDSARRFLDTIKSEIEDNETFIGDFGELKGTTWNALEVVTANNVKLQAAGAGEALRGLRYGSYRPSLVIDDMENDESCSTPERISKMMDFFDRTLMPLGDPTRSKYYFVGTIISYNSVLSQVIHNRPDWKAFKYSAIETFPTNMHLWNEWEDIFHDRSLGDNPIDAARLARSSAMSFYHEHKAEMDEGAKVLWPERLDLLALMERRATRRLAFNSEFQNQPLDPDTRIFHTIHYYEPNEIDIDELDVYGACDPSIGKTTRSDPSAIVTVGRSRKTGVIYVLDVDVKRRHPDAIIQDIFKKARQFRYVKFSIETTAFQQFFKDEVMRRSSQQGVYLPLTEFKTTQKKHMRILSLEPILTNGQLRILRSHVDFEEQALYYPRGSHDDVLDCTSQVLELCKGASGFVFGKI